MKFLKKMFLIGVFMHHSFCSYSQKSNNIYNPNIWLQDITKIDSLKSKLNFHQELKLGTKNNWFTKDRLKKSNNLYVVFKSESQEPIISILGENHSFFLQSDSFKLKNENDITGYNQSFGELMDFRLGDFGENMFVINNKLNNVQLYEVILDHNLSEYKSNEVRTYLSIKYGIDLIDYKQYVYKDNKQLWSKTSNNANIFGIGKFNYFNLKQLKSTHSKNKNWTIQFSDKIKTDNLNDGDYVLIGDNNKTLSFINDVSQRKWTIQNNLTTSIDLFWNFDSYSESDIYDYFLKIDGKIISGNYNTTDIAFKNIDLSPGTHDLTLQRKKSDVIIESDIFCSSSIIKIMDSSKKLLRNISYRILDEKGNQLNSGNYNSTIELHNINSPFLVVEVVYKNKVYSKKIDLYPSNWNNISINKSYVLEDSNPIHIKLPFNNYKSIQWFKDTKHISKESEILLTETGEYQLIITSQDDCVREYSFKVSKAQSIDSWNIYPNPASTGEIVSCEFNWKDNKKVDLKVYQEDGKLVQSFPAFYTKDKTIQNLQLSTSGVYIIVAYIDNNLEIKKLIIK